MIYCKNCVNYIDSLKCCPAIGYKEYTKTKTKNKCKKYKERNVIKIIKRTFKGGDCFENSSKKL